MIQIAGKLTVRQITGRNGVFAVGELVTEIGMFKVKDQILDQFEEGEYRGTFYVERIFPDSYFNYGRFVIEIRAHLSGFQLDDEVTPAEPAAPAEPDPADQAGDSVNAALQATDTPDQLDTSADEGEDDDPDHALFGDELYAAVQNREMVKLDPTIDRTKFRQQRDRLKALDYSFDATTQSWSCQS